MLHSLCLAALFAWSYTCSNKAEGSGSVLMKSVECSKLEKGSGNMLFLEAFWNYQFHLTVLFIPWPVDMGIFRKQPADPDTCN